MAGQAGHAAISRVALRGLAISVLWIAVAPVLHRFPLPHWLDTSLAQLLDDLEPRVPPLLPGEVLRSTGWSVFHPERYHGPESWTTSGSAEDGFFEGWYYKLVTGAGRTLVVIPGVIQGKGAESDSGGFSFVMVADPTKSATERVQLHRYALAALESSRDAKEWTLRIGPNTFSTHGLTLAINNSRQRIEGRVDMLQSAPWPTTLFLPDVMGWFAWIPGMECRHGVLSLRSSMRGALAIDGEEVPMDGGAAYIEKDWGSNFPKTWVWVQGNHFLRDVGGFETASLMLSIASIPFPSDRFEVFRFRGFLGGVWLPQLGGLFRFATYTGAVIEKLVTDSSQSQVTVTIRSAQHRLFVSAEGSREAAALLNGPLPGGKFEPFVHEMLGASVVVRLTRRSDGHVIFEGRSVHAGLEIESKEPGGIRNLDTYECCGSSA